MRGYVHTINRRRGRVAIATDGHGYTIIEMLGSDNISIGDWLEWPDDHYLGSATYTNLTKAIPISVNVRCHGVPETVVRRMLRL
jgi:hypothetical protein